MKILEQFLAVIKYICKVLYIEHAISYRLHLYFLFNLMYGLYQILIFFIDIKEKSWKDDHNLLILSFIR